MRKYILLTLLALFCFSDLVYSQDEMTMQVTSMRAREKKGNSWSSWTSWVPSEAIIYCGEDEDGDLAFYYEDDENSENDFYLVITYASAPTYDSSGGEHMTARVTDVSSGDRGTLEWYTYPSGDRNQFTLKFSDVELQFRTKDI